MISIIIPIYNAEKHIEKCVSSIIKQNFEDYELLLVNDGSTDGTAKLCDSLAAYNKKIRVLHKENGGAASARNLGLDNAKCDYIAFIDADDTVEPDYLKRLYEAAINHNADMVMCDYTKHTANGSYPFSQPIRGGVYSKQDIEKELYPCLIMFDNLEFPPTISNCVCLFKRCLLIDNGIKYPTVRLCEDSYFGSAALYNANGFVYLKNEYLYNYIYYPTSVSHTSDPQKIASRWQSFLLINECYENRFNNKEYDFSMQIKYNMLYFTLNQLSYINGQKYSLSKQRKEIIKIIKDKRVRRMMKGIKYPKVPFKLKLFIFFIKHRLALPYCLLHR